MAVLVSALTAAHLEQLKCLMISYDAGQDIQAKFADLHNDSLEV